MGDMDVIGLGRTARRRDGVVLGNRFRGRRVWHGASGVRDGAAGARVFVRSDGFALDQRPGFDGKDLECHVHATGRPVDRAVAQTHRTVAAGLCPWIDRVGTDFAMAAGRWQGARRQRHDPGRPGMAPKERAA